MKYIGFLVCLLFFGTVTFSQNKKWILGSSMVNSSGILNSSSPGALKFYEADFTGSVPVFIQRTLGASVNSISSAGINETLNSTTDSAGSILFYVFANCTSAFSGTTSDTTYFVAFDASSGKDEVFATLPPAGIGASSAKDLNIVKREGTSDQYFVIYKTSCTNQYSIDEIRYVIVNMDTKTISAPITLLSSGLNEGMAVSLKNCTAARWSFFVKYVAGDYNIYRSAITSSGISSPVLINTISIPGNVSLGQGDIEISPTSDKIAFINYTTGSVNKDVIIFDFALATGVLSNERWIDNPANYIIEAEFSPDGQRLYLFRGGTSAITPELYNVSVPSAGTNYTITTADKLSLSFTVGHTLEMAFDDRLYFATSKYNTQLYSITNPNANAASTIIATTPPFSFGPGAGISFTLPEQIDGQENSSLPMGVSIVSSAAVICPGETVTLTAMGGSVYQWNGNVTDSAASIIVAPVVTTTYYVAGTTALCGNGNDTITVNVDSFIPAQFSFSSEKCSAEIGFNNSSPGANDYLWNFGDGTTSQVYSPVHTYGQGSYNVIMYTNPGMLCVDSTLQVVSVSDSSPTAINFPNVFTPNNDGVNDEFRITGFSECSSYYLSIFNRWGQKIFETNTPEKTFWDGKNGDKKEIVEGVYYYILTVEELSKQIDIEGAVNVLK
jgi:gliding motility-associated-like protein